MRSLRIALAVGLAVLLAGPTLAQQQRQRGGQGGIGALLQNESVQKELKIEGDQVNAVKEAVQKVQDKYRDDFAKLRDLGQEERRTKTQELTRTVTDETLKSVSDILKPEQIKRLKQIELQQAGARAFTRPDVVKALGLKEEQNQQIKKIVDDFAGQQRELTQGGNAQQNREKLATLRKETSEKVQAVLTDDQKKAWKDLTGESFQVRFQRRQQNGNG